MINLELPLPPLQSALKSATNATSANLRLTKRNGDAILTLTATTISAGSGVPANGFLASGGGNDLLGDDEFREESLEGRNTIGRETLVTQEIPIRVLSVESVKDLHEPVLREPDVNILLPSLLQLKAISDRFTKLALSTTSRGAYSSAASGPKLELSANMFGSLKISLTTDSLNINSVWTDLLNPEVQDKTDEEKAELPSTKMRDAGKEAWATVRIDGKDWGRVLSVGRLGGRVVACEFDLCV
jgi:HUS1 checkpoint protein